MSILRYLVDTRWWKKWKKFVGYQESDEFGVGEELNDPGPIDNSNLFASKTLHHLHDLYYFISHSRTLCHYSNINFNKRRLLFN